MMRIVTPRAVGSRFGPSAPACADVRRRHPPLSVSCPARLTTKHPRRRSLYYAAEPHGGHATIGFGSREAPTDRANPQA